MWVFACMWWWGQSDLMLPSLFSLEPEKLQAEGGWAEVHQCGWQLPDGACQEEPGTAERGESWAALSPATCCVMGLGTSGTTAGAAQAQARSQRAFPLNRLDPAFHGLPGLPTLLTIFLLWLLRTDVNWHCSFSVFRLVPSSFFLLLSAFFCLYYSSFLLPPSLYSFLPFFSPLLPIRG